jgi:hypothetical protein
LVKAIKFQGKRFLFFKIIALSVLLVFLFLQLKKLNFSFDTIVLSNFSSLILVLFLMPLNWCFEWLKWKEVVRFSGDKPTSQQRYHSFWAGIVSGMLTPNMLGNFLGRIYYFKRTVRFIITYLTLLGSFSQFLITILFGGLALVFLNKIPFGYSLDQLRFVLLCGIFVALVGYFFAEYIVLKRRTRTRIIEKIQENGTVTIFKIRSLVFSLFRHLVFTAQFVLMLHAFGASFSWTLVLWVWQVYLWVTMSPSLILGKVFIRDSIAVVVLMHADLGLEPMSILIASFLIWVINLLLPTLLALIILKQKKAND